MELSRTRVEGRDRAPVPTPPAATAIRRVRRTPSRSGSLVVGRDDDPYEREAESIAARVMRSLAATGGTRAGPRAGPVEPTTGRIRRMSTAGGPAGGEVDAETEDRIRRAGTGGRALAGDVRAPMEAALGADLGHVRLHTGPEPARLNTELGARAFTLGSDVFLGSGVPSFATPAGQHLLAHELTHTVQQAGVQRVVRRLPTWTSVRQEVGDPKTGSSVTGREKSKNYRAFGQALQDYNTAADNVIAADAGARAAQYLDLAAKLDSVHAATLTYHRKHKTDARARVVTDIGNQAQLEKAVLKTRKNFFDANPPGPGVRWREVLPTSMGTRVVHLDEGAAGVQQQGGINTVTQYDVGGFQGFYKKAESGFRQGTPEPGIAKDLGIPATDPNMDKRSLASWRIDQLLNANVLSRTEIAFEHKGGKRRGVISEAAAGGEKFGVRGNRPGEFYRTAADRGNDPAAKPDAFTGDDPVLQRCLSKLTIVDALCGQVDRHAGNWFVQTDGAGNVVGVVGIDNDLAFPESKGSKRKNKKLRTWEDVTHAYRAYPGVGIYFDWEMAETVLALDPADLAAVVDDLLPPNAVKVLLRRLGSLKAEINKAKAANRLLTPAQWGAAVNPKGGGANPETHGYLSDAVR